MSNRIVRTVLTFCCVVVVVTCIHVVPKLWADNVARHAANDAAQTQARDVAGQVAHKALDEAARDAAQRIAAQVRADMDKQQAAGVSQPAPTPALAPLLVERAAFRITLPGDATIDAPSPDADADHLTEINLPTGGALIILVADDKESGAATYDKMLERLRGKFANVAASDTHTFDSIKPTRSTGFSGVVEGERSLCEVARFDGRAKSCVIVVSCSESKRPQVIQAARAALASFEMKQ